MPVTFSWGVDFGQVIILFGSIASVVGGFYAIKSKVDIVDGKFTAFQEVIMDLKREISQIREVIISNARLDERVSALSARMTSMEGRERGGG